MPHWSKLITKKKKMMRLMSKKNQIFQLESLLKASEKSLRYNMLCIVDLPKRQLFCEDGSFWYFMHNEFEEK